MKRFSILCAVAVAGVMAYLAPPSAKADDLDKKTVVTLNAPTEAPGIVLQPGTYMIKLLNSSSNRHIAEIMNEKGDHLYALTFTAAAERVFPTSKTTLTFYEGTNGRPQALKRWFWPGDENGQEFIYPKNQADKIAAATKEKVPEGKLPTVAESGQSLTPDNAQGDTKQEVSEKNQSPSPATLSAAEIPARTNDHDADNEKPQVSDRSSDNTVIAQNTPPPAVTPTPADTTAPSTASTDTDRNLPQTASQLPLMMVIGVVSVGLALIAGLFRSKLTSSL